MRKTNSKWTLNSADVTSCGMSMRLGGRKKASQSRALDTRSKELSLKHDPTNIEVKGEISAGNYSRKEMRNLEAKLYNKLFVELERKVAKKLRVAGYF